MSPRKHLVTETYLIKPAWTETVVDHPACDETIHHAATYKTVVDKPAWNENKLIKAGYTSPRDYVQVGSRWIATQGHWATR